MIKRLLAAFIFFTRLPFWCLAAIQTKNFKHVVPCWLITGWLTGGILTGTLWLLSQILPIEIAWIGAIIARLLVTGCLHEDGLADFCDGFGGGTTRERVLAIMKDSHIGTYGVAGLIIYFLLLSQMGSIIPLATLCAVAFCADVYAKRCVSHIVNLLPYARKEEESKAKVTYNRMTLPEGLIGLIALRDTCLLELNFGTWEMQRYDDIRDPHLAEWYADYLHQPATNGESFEEQLGRVSFFFNKLKKKSYHRVAVFTHGGVIACA